MFFKKYIDTQYMNQIREKKHYYLVKRKVFKMIKNEDEDQKCIKKAKFLMYLSVR